MDAIERKVRSTQKTYVTAKIPDEVLDAFRKVALQLASQRDFWTVVSAAMLVFLEQPKAIQSGSVAAVMECEVLRDYATAQVFLEKKLRSIAEGKALIAAAGKKPTRPGPPPKNRRRNRAGGE